LFGRNLIAGCLMNAGASVCDLDNNNTSPFELACWSGNERMVLSMIALESGTPMFRLDGDNTSGISFLLGLVKDANIRLPLVTT